MRLTKDEIIKYILIILVAGFIPIVLQLIPSIAGFFPNSPLFGSSYLLTKHIPLMTWLCFFTRRIATAFYIHLSERRIGNDVNIIWQLFGLVFGFTGFVGYCLWVILDQKEMFFNSEQS